MITADLIEYTFIAYANSTYGASEELLAAAETGFLETQDVILCDMVGADVYTAYNGTINESLIRAQEKGTELYSISSKNTPSYFDYISENTDDSDPICTYYQGIDTTEKGIENAENLLMYLAMRTKITYIGYSDAYSENECLEIASQTNDHSDLIEYTFIAYANSTYGASEELLAAAETGFLETQDVILCDMVGADVYTAYNGTINESLIRAQEKGTELYSISSKNTPSYFDYISENTDDSDPICTYYQGIDTTEEGIENAEKLLMYLATGCSTFSEIAILGNDEVDFNKFIFILGTEFNEVSLNNATLDTNISENLNVTIFTPSNPVPDEFDFSGYGVIFIESQNESLVDGWTSSIKSAKSGGAMVIGYNLSSNVTVSNVDLYSEEYTDIERYWIQGGDSNMESMLKFMGQKFSDQWVSESISKPEVVHPKINVTYILNDYGTLSTLNNVLSERAVVTDRFNVSVMNGEYAVENLVDVSDQDVIILYMLRGTQITELKAVFQETKAEDTQIGMFGIDNPEIYGIATFDMNSSSYNFLQEYFYNNGYSNMEQWIRAIGFTFEGAYIEYSEATQPSIPDHGIYHPDAFPRIFEDSGEYLEWYKNHGYNASAPTIGIIANYKIGKDPLVLTADDQIIRNLESKGCNVIYSTFEVITDDGSECFVNNDEVIVDSIISLKGFNFEYKDPSVGVKSLNEYNVPVIKGLLDTYHTPDMYNSSVHGLNTLSLPSQVTMPELEGLIDYIWIAGGSEVEGYHQPLTYQIDWMCDRAISWAELSKMSNSDKKVSIIYYNHEGGKNNIGASYLDIASSFEVLLDSMNASGYDTGNGSIPNSSEFIDLFIESRNVGSWAPGELEKVVESGNVTLVPVDDYLEWYNTLPQSVRDEVEARWGEAPGNIMVYEGQFVIPTIQLGNINFIPQPTRGDLSDELVMYHDKDLPPTHQYLATYFWINQVYDADAMIHFGTHGTQEWLPGKEVGLWRYDYPSIMVADTPVVYPYIMDNVGEGTQAKRRGNAVIIDHLIPPITDSGLYGELAEMHDKIHEYEEAADANNSARMALYRNSTIEKYENLSMEYDLGVSPDQMRAMSEVEFEDFVTNDVHNYLHELQGTLMPLGLHVFGVAPADNKLVCMVKSMLHNDFIQHIATVIQYENTSWDEEDLENVSNYRASDLLNATLLNGANVSQAQLDVLGIVDSNITADLNMAHDYSIHLKNTTHEIDQTLNALNGGYVEPGPGNDPIRNPDTLPTGRNFYSFDPRTIPDAETEILGAALADQMLEQYNSTHGTYPKKVTYILWSVETMRHEGLMEAQIYSLLGVKLERDSNGYISGYKVIPQEDMTHPRIDVVVTPSGLYRDTFPHHLQWIDQAVREVAALDESNESNYVRWNSLIMEEALLEQGYDNDTALILSRSRIFSESPGAYGTGLPGAITASDTWESEDELADLYMSRMSNIYGQDIWGESYEDVFRMNLQDVEVAMHSDSSNLYGIIDNDDFYQYLGGLSLAVRSLTGENPEMYVADFKNADNPEIITFEEAYRKDIRSTLFNPKFISGMMEYDYAGAREFMNTIEHIWGLDVTTPDMVTDSDWDEIYAVYVEDKYDLGVDEFMKSDDNVYAYQATLKRMIEAERKGYWDASDEVLRNLVAEYTKSVVENGVTCCHHTCGNALLDEYVQGIMSVPGVVDQTTIDEYNKLMQDATQRYPETSSHKSSSNTPSANVVNSTTTNVDGGYGTTTDQPTDAAQQSTPDNYVEGYEMTRESTPEESSSSSFSGSDIMGALLVLAAVGAISIGLRRRRL
ncbi:CobN-like chelatase BtuS for metalloporphyrine salvage [Methanococcoides methylutens MM1]|uniref:CobN-like chelatase BtuS for metalloporphyrine salvage n=2 Tax=Methanococcoides methylutens TaxID=2226 RepID=A0A0E3SPG7_METMT|nr:CobN-like chelatase BtuS for metalloporphyrine salvage [Methanococcoides methylutens MM1]